MPDPQQPAAPAGPGVTLETPQASPAAARGPDSHAGAQTLSQALGTPANEWEGKYRALQGQFDQARQQWDRRQESMSGELRALREQVAAMAQPPAAPEPKEPAAPAKAKAPAPAASVESALESAIRAQRAAQYRDLLIGNMTRPGSPYEGLPLNLFAANIPVVEPVVGSDGQLDDSGQRAAIESFAKALKQYGGDTGQQAQQAILAGTMPGSSPGVAPGGNSAADLYQEFQDLMAVYGSEAFMDLTKQEQADLQERYYELAADPIIQGQHSGNLQPTMDLSSMSQMVRDLAQKVAALSGQNPMGAGVF